MHTPRNNRIFTVLDKHKSLVVKHMYLKLLANYDVLKVVVAQISGLHE